MTRRSSGTTSSAAATRPTCRCGASSPRAEAGPVLDVGAGTGRVALDLARAGHAVTALDRDPVLLAALRARAPREGSAVAHRRADAAGFDLAGRAFGLIARPDADDPAAGGRAARARSSRPRARTSRRRPAWRSRSPRSSRRSRPTRRAAAARHAASATAGATSPSPSRSARAATRVVLERVREAIAPDGSATRDGRRDRARHARRAADARGRGRAAGLRAGAGRARSPTTDEHVGSRW